MLLKRNQEENYILKGFVHNEHYEIIILYYFHKYYYV